ncbi:MAG: helix-turn-helix domain-containing protein [Dehalococcoidia bacterium]
MNREEELRLLSAWTAEATVGPLADVLVPRLVEELRRQPPVERLAYSVADVVDATGFSRDRVFALIRSGQLPSLKLEGRRYVRKTDLEAFLEREVRRTASEIEAENQPLARQARFVS